MKRWVFAFRVEPPPHTVLVRFGAVVFDAFFSKWFGWQAVYPGGKTERIAEPDMMFVSEEWAKEHERKTFCPVRSTNKIRLSKKSEQLSFAL